MSSNVRKSESKKVSVIVPCFNVGRLIQPLLNSIKKQNYENFEVIFVNDGSTDDTLDVLKQFCNDELSTANRQYRLIEKGNGGLSSARNAGLNAAEGDLVFFVDSDDCLFPQSLSKLAELMKEGIDVAVGTFRNFNGDVCSFPHISDPDKFLRATFTKGGLTLWNKMFRRSIIEENHLRFDTSIKTSEDHLFTAQYLLYAKGSISVTDYMVYLYQLNPLSLSKISATTGTFSPWSSDSVFVACRIYRLMMGKLSKPTLRELRYDTYHKYRRVRHEAHVLNCKDQLFYDSIYKEMRTIMPLWEMIIFAIRRRMSIIVSSAIRKFHRHFPTPQKGDWGGKEQENPT